MEKAKKVDLKSFTHFASVPIDLKLIGDIAKYQDSWMEALPEQKKSVLSKRDNDKFHFTLCMLALAQQSQQQKAINSFGILQPELQKILQEKPLTLTFEKLDAFSASKDQTSESSQYENAKLIYIKLKEDDNFKKLRMIDDLIIRTFLQQEVFDESDLQNMSITYNHSSGKFETELHLSLFNVNTKQGPVSFKEEIEKSVVEIPKLFVPFKVNHVDISTRGEFDENGFYKPLVRIEI